MTEESEKLFGLIDTLLDDDKLPTYTNSGVLGHLAALASEAFKRDTFDGYLSYVLISHQVCEDYVMVLLRHAQYTLRLHVVPNGFGWPTEKYEEPGVRAKAMFGGLLQLLQDSIDFDQKEEFIEACRKQNEIRNRFAHRLIDGQGMTLDDIRTFARKYAEGDRAVIESFNAADEDFSWFYFMQRVDARWDKVIGTQIDKAEKEDDRYKWEAIRKKFRDTFTEQWKRQERTWRESWRKSNPPPSWME